MKTLTLAGLVIIISLFSCKPKPNGQIAQVLRADEAMDLIVSRDAELEIIDTTFQFTEGPVWNVSGFLLFSDIPVNKIIKWVPGEGFSTFLEPSHNTNGLTFDSDGNLVMCAHSARGIFRLNSDGSLSELAHKYKGLKLNSPNDLVISSKNILYFTDPCWGLDGLENSADKEVKFNGLYMVTGDSLQVIDTALWRPNGLTLSPDQKTLYVTDMFANPTNEIKVLYRYKLDDNGTPVSRDLMISSSPQDEILSEEGGFDGIKTDINGNIYCTGPQGIVILNPDGKYLGTILTPLSPANCAWGGADFKTLYITARQHLYRINLNIEGFSPQRN